MGPAPRSAGTNPAEHHPRGRILAEAGGAPRRPLAAEPDRDGPRRMDTGGRAGLGTGAPGPGSLVVVDRRGGDRAGPWAVAGEGGGVDGPGGLGDEPREAFGGWARAPEGGRSLKGGGGGGCSLPGGRRGPLLSEGGGGRVSPGVGPCRFMAARHGTISPTLCAGVPFFGGAEGGRGGLAVMGCSLPCGGGVAGGSSVRLGRVNPVASPQLVGPFEEEPRIRRGGLRYIYIYMANTQFSPPPTLGQPVHCGARLGTPPPILGSGNTKHHVLEVNWMVIGGYLPL